MRSKKLLFASLFSVLLGCCVSQMALAQSFNCDNFIGTWRFDGDDYNMSAQRTVVVQFFADQSFYADMRHRGQESEGRSIHTGRWQCRGGVQTLHKQTINGFAVAYSEDYEIMELSPAYFRIRSTPENCEYSGSDCPTTYEYFRQ